MAVISKLERLSSRDKYETRLNEGILTSKMDRFLKFSKRSISVLKFFRNAITMDRETRELGGEGIEGKKVNGGRVMEFFTRAMVVTRRANRPRKRENERREGRRRKRKRDKRPVIPVALDARWVCITTTRRLLSLHCLSTYQPLLRIVRTFLPTDFYSISFFGKRSKRRTRGSRFRNCSPQIIRPYWYFSFFFFFRPIFLFANRTEIRIERKFRIFPISRGEKKMHRSYE